MPTPIELEIRYLPPSVRRRCEKALGLPSRDAEHKVFVYGTLIAGEAAPQEAPATPAEAE